MYQNLKTRIQVGAALAAMLLLTQPSFAVTVADLVIDYDELGAIADSTEAVFPGLVSGTWSAFSDDDNDPLNGGLDLLLFRNSVGLEGGNGFAGAGTIFGDCCGPMPVLSDDGLFDGILTPPADTLAIHPGQSGDEGPEFLVLQYTAASNLSGASINFSFDTPGGGGIDVTLLDTNGVALDDNVGTGVFSGSRFIGDLAAGESFYAVVGNGPGNDPGTDQTWVQLSVEDGLTDPGDFVAIVDRDTGNLTLSNSTVAPIDVLGYSITSASGALIASEWKSVSLNYDADGPNTADSGALIGSVDDDDNWTLLSQDSTDLSEAELNPAGTRDGGVIAAAPNASEPVVVDFGEVWQLSPFEDLQFEILRTNGDREVVELQYINNGGQAFDRSDFNVDGIVDATDWMLFRSNLFLELSQDLTIAEAYAQGDLDGDLDIDIEDFALFKADFIAANGPAAFQALFGAVPEPSSAVSLFACVALLSTTRRWCRLGARFAAIALACFACFFFCNGVADASVVADLAIDYSEIGANPNSTTAVFSGTTTGQWNALSDTDTNPVNGGTDLLLFRSSVGLEGGDGFAGAGTIFGDCCGPMPVLSDDGLFDGITAPPAGTLAIHPGESGDGGPEFLVIQYTATTALTGVAFDYSIEQPNGASDGIDFTFVDNDGNELANFPVDGASIVDRQFFGDLAAGESIYAVVGNGPANNPAADQSWLNLTVNDFAAPLTASVNTQTGFVTFTNPSDEAVDLDLYRIASAGGALDTTGWLSLQDQDLAGFPAGDGTGNGWEEVGGASDSVLGEALLQGDSTLGAFESIELGIAFDPSVFGEGQDGDLVLQYRTPTGQIVDGLIEYDATPTNGLAGDFNNDGSVDAADYTVWRDNLGSDPAVLNGNGVGAAVVSASDYALWAANFGQAQGSAIATPEPTSAALVLLSVGSFLVTRRHRGVTMQRVPADTSASLSFASLAFFLLASTSLAAVTTERDYRFGDDGLEGGANGSVVGASNQAPATSGQTLDSEGPGGAFIDLTVNGSPVYVDTSSRPGAEPGEQGISFSGSSQSLTTPFSLNSPNAYWDDPDLFPNNDYPFNYDGLFGRGIQVWARPDSAKQGVRQDIVLDTQQHGVFITENDTWALLFGGREIDSGVAVDFDEWNHLMVVNPGAAVLYVDGVAVTAEGGFFFGDNSPLSVASNQDSTDNFFQGELDDLEIFVFGDNTGVDATNNNPDAVGRDYGAFLLSNDNDFAVLELAGIDPADINRDGVVDQVDIDVFVQNWGEQNLVNDIQVGDLNFRDSGDLDFDGVVDLDDVFILHEGLLNAGVATGFPFEALSGGVVPEPSAIVALVTLLATSTVASRRK